VVKRLEFINKRQLSDLLKISVVTIDRQRKKGLPFHKLGGKVVFIYDEVAEWIKNGNEQ